MIFEENCKPRETHTVYLTAQDKYQSAELNAQITDLWNQIVLAANPVATGKTKGIEGGQLKFEDGNMALSIWSNRSEFLTATFNDLHKARDVAHQLERKTTPSCLPVTIALVENAGPGTILR